MLVLHLRSGNSSIAHDIVGEDEVFTVLNWPIFAEWLKTKPEGAVVAEFESAEKTLQLSKLLKASGDYSLVLIALERQTPHLTGKGVLHQQFLRYIAMKHHGAFVVVDDFSKVDPLALVELAKGEPIPVFEKSGPQVGGSTAHLVIPTGWDLWNRIELLGKTISESSSTLTLETIEALDGAYSNYIETGDPRVLDILGESRDAPSPRKPLLFESLVLSAFEEVYT